jgi:beta-N-acetylglucosaminidase
MARNLQYQWCEQTGATDKEFLGWIYQRLHDVFGERMTLDYMRRLDKIIQDTPGIIPNKMTKILENNPVLREQREAFRKALNDLGHSEATVYSHWALEAFDTAFRLREPE